MGPSGCLNIHTAPGGRRPAAVCSSSRANWSVVRLSLCKLWVITLLHGSGYAQVNIAVKKKKGSRVLKKIHLFSFKKFRVKKKKFRVIESKK